MDDRKKSHIELALDNQIEVSSNDERFYYEPLMAPHYENFDKPVDFLGFRLQYPVWVSSMTGGTKMAGTINHNLARLCNEFGLGMGLGSCRVLLENDNYLDDFNVKKIIGANQPLFANIGISQAENLIEKKEIHKINDLLAKLQADGLIIHVNPLQEFTQPEGDRLKRKPIEIIEILTSEIKTLFIVKEVGQGMGPESLNSLLKLKIDAIEFGAFGGTNFASIELQRVGARQKEMYLPLVRIGHSAAEMLEFINSYIEKQKPLHCKNLIISGGIKSFLDGYYFTEKSVLPAIYGQASAFLKYAQGSYSELKEFFEFQIKGLILARSFLKIRK